MYKILYSLGYTFVSIFMLQLNMNKAQFFSQFLFVNILHSFRISFRSNYDEEETVNRTTF